MSSYDLIKDLSKRYTTHERDELGLTLLRRVQSKYNLSNLEVQEIWKAVEESPQKCRNVKSVGVFRGTKCRRAVKEDTTNTNKHIFCSKCKS